MSQGKRGNKKKNKRKESRALPKLFSLLHSSGANFVLLKRSFIGLSAL